ncbi:hydrolase [Ligilactobacillus aviarius]|uniref:Cof-type HAD-IIB family hydrolase n=1 Tax=Ligilactobacillus aviarius TaxID=1606 RepID=UPI0007DA459D|nr:Cof-type HAD-IIB family hydrolase [Ligilactobacillus aviarius]OAQ08841.1 hydrolase [Ligilactobacillus aviarius]OAS76318.1 hydrolase [Ligilactobacillus aviarius]
MQNDIKLVATDIDGTFTHADHTYDVERFKRILTRMNAAGCEFVVASGSQYFTIRDLFADCADQINFISENGAMIESHGKIITINEMATDVVDEMILFAHHHPEIEWVMCGAANAYCERGQVDQAFFDQTNFYYHHLKWVADFNDVDDQILKFAINVPEKETDHYLELFRREFAGKIEPTSSGFGAIDLIVPGNHKAAALKHLVQRWDITPAQCAAFGDGGNDIEMLRYCNHSYAMANAPAEVKQVAQNICPSNEDDGVLVTLDQLF